MNEAILTCALTGVLTDPAQYPVPVTAAQMAAEARDAFNAGASIMHVHLRRQDEGQGQGQNQGQTQPEAGQTPRQAQGQSSPGPGEEAAALRRL